MPCALCSCFVPALLPRDAPATHLRNHRFGTTGAELHPQCPARALRQSHGSKPSTDCLRRVIASTPEVEVEVEVAQ